MLSGVTAASDGGGGMRMRPRVVPGTTCGGRDGTLTPAVVGATVVEGERGVRREAGSNPKTLPSPPPPQKSNIWINTFRINNLQAGSAGWPRCPRSARCSPERGQVPGAGHRVDRRCGATVFRDGSVGGGSPCPGASLIPAVLRAAGLDSLRLRAVVAGGGKLESAAVRVVQTVAGSLRGAGGKSELRRAVRWVTPSPGDRKESATENRPPLRSRSGKGEKVR